MIGKFIDTMLDKKGAAPGPDELFPCFRKEVGAHGIEERGVYRIHQFEKQGDGRRLRAGGEHGVV